MDFTYEQAPLVEVIAEAFWPLIPLSAIPGGAVDPFFLRASNQFREEVAALGYGVTESIVPPGVPMEMIPNQVVTRYRHRPEGWPLFQVGPGIFTANMVPPYAGWGAFRSTLADGYAAATRAYQKAGRAENDVDHLSLRYINAFTAAHGFDGKQAIFLDQHLGLRVDIARELPEGVRVEWDMREIQLVLHAPSSAPKGSRFTLMASVGHAADQPACILELAIRGRPENDAIEWFDQAREAIRLTFESLISPDLQERIGPRVDQAAR
ncbi:TIGR04255 family protein [Methylobacterium sp. E-046]|uniref:TIGR04255 family protein n=1 Tax=Methylobacterium sp. E-046 TaxID=2836576 RepID=UPI001FB9B665|nr:TIGR04255 family protein [Methylobacterium sp. E-046]MCJ2098919.1 TIGR04255 family protein [Methylobacterium sp. E-046]